MNKSTLWALPPHFGRPFLSVPGKSLSLAIAATLLAIAPFGARAAAPGIVSVTPPTGATGVGTNSQIVIVFDQDMDVESTPVGSFPPFLVGNFAVTPSTLLFTGSWGDDERTLTLECVTALPSDTTISWTLNPPGGGIVPPIQSSVAEPVATVSGSFKTAAGGATSPAPRLVSVSPANGATDVSPASSVVFIFDQEMDTSVPPIPGAPPFSLGNYQFGPVAVSGLFSGSWGADRHTLTFQPLAAVAPGTTVTWSLNPVGTAVPLKSATGQALAVTNGSYQVVGNTGGNTNELCGGPSPFSGSYVLTKNLNYDQTGPNAVTLRPEAPPTFGAFVESPVGGPAVTNATLAFPNNAVIGLSNAFGHFIFLQSRASESELEALAPPGNYVMRIAQSGQVERVIPMTVPATPASIPTIANYAEARAIDASKNFTLVWNRYSPQGANAFISVQITDDFGNLIFLAPNPCVPRVLAPNATSVVIPANYLKPGFTYHGVISFGITFYSSSNAVPQMIGYGSVQRTTMFDLVTAGGTGGAAPAIFTASRVLPNGHPQFELSGTPARIYAIQRTGSLGSPNWTSVGSVTMDGAGKAVFEDSSGVLGRSDFYRAESAP